MYIRGTYQIFEKMIFAKVSLTLLISLIKAFRGAQAKAKLTILDAGKNQTLGEFYS